jgi:hypothetical protein
MAIELIVDKLDGLDDGIKDAYFKKDGKYYLDPDKYAETKRDSRIGELEKELKHFKLTVPLSDIMVKAGLNPKDTSLALLEVASKFALNEKGKIILLDDEGDDSGVTPERYFEEVYKKERPNLYLPPDAAGSGAPGGTQRAAGSGGHIITREEAKDPYKYRAAKKRAAEAGVELQIS